MGYTTRIKKYIRTGAQRATKQFGKKYGISYGRRGLRMQKGTPAKLAALATTVAGIASRLNVEKKYAIGSVQTGFVGQTNFFNTTEVPGYFYQDLTPTISQGNGENERNGNSLKITGLHMKWQFKGMSACHSDRRLKIHLIKTTSDKGFSDIVAEMFDVNPLTGLYDFHSNKDYTNNKGSHKILRTKNLKLRQETGGPGYTQNPDGKAIADCTFNLKLQEMFRYELNSSTLPNDVKFFILVFCDTGNRSAAIDSANPGVLVPNANSGVELQNHHKWWYVDN